MTQSSMDMTTLYQRLSKIGFPKSYVQKHALPDWWDKELEQTEGAAVEAAAYISRRLNLDIRSLLYRERSPEFDKTYTAKFKVKKGQDSQKLNLAYSLAIRVAELVAYSFPQPYQPIHNLTVQDIRAEILRDYKLVTLKSILQWLWSRGIPVLHFDQYPKSLGNHKFHGMIVQCHGIDYEAIPSRPVIVVSLNHFSSSKLLFIIAHELGHLHKGHIDAQDFLIDVEADQSSDNDSEETEANEVAVELLTGSPDTCYDTPQRVKAERLQKLAQDKSLQDVVDPGVVINNYAWSMKIKGIDCHPPATKALKQIEGHEKAPELINKYLENQIDWDRLSSDNQEYLRLALNLSVK